MSVLERVYSMLAEKHSDELINVDVRRSPGVPGKVEPFYGATASLNGTIIYWATNGHQKAEQALEALEQDIKRR